jgi:hypothetical protein
VACQERDFRRLLQTGLKEPGVRQKQRMVVHPGDVGHNHDEQHNFVHAQSAKRERVQAPDRGRPDGVHSEEHPPGNVNQPDSSRVEWVPRKVQCEEQKGEAEGHQREHAQSVPQQGLDLQGRVACDRLAGTQRERRRRRGRAFRRPDRLGRVASIRPGLVARGIDRRPEEPPGRLVRPQQLFDPTPQRLVAGARLRHVGRALRRVGPVECGHEDRLDRARI